MRSSLCLLLALPPELLSLICKQLSLAERCLLMISCRQLYWASRAPHSIFAYVWTSPARFDERCRFEILRMLESDRVVRGRAAERGGKERYCCWGCLRTHARERFSCDELAKKVDYKTKPSYKQHVFDGVRARYCVATQKCIRFGSCGWLSFVDLHHLAHAHPGNLITVREPRGIWPGTVFDLRTRELCQDFPLSYRFETVSSFDKFAALCRAANHPLCPHLCIGDEDVIKLYKPSLFRWESRPRFLRFRDPPNVRMRSLRCKHCKTKVILRQVGTNTWYRTLRYFGNLKSPYDRAFLSQAVSAQDPNLDAHCWDFKLWVLTAHNKWLSHDPEYCDNFVPCMPQPDYNNLFSPVTLLTRKVRHPYACKPKIRCTFECTDARILE